MGKLFRKNNTKMTETEETTIQEEKQVEEPQTEQTGEATQHKASRGEKKFKKSLTKLGMKQVTGINRVTLKTSKNFVLYIEDPDILKSTDNAYVIFGECKMFDYGQNFAADKASAFEKPDVAQPTEVPTDKPEDKVEDEGEADDEDAGDIAEESINTLMEYANCSRAKAIKGLKKTGGDVVEAITLVS